MVLFMSCFVRRKYSKENQTNSLVLNLKGAPFINALNKNILVYPFHQLKLMMVFVYGNDFKRQTNEIYSILITIGSIYYICLITTIVCVIRRKLKLERRGFLSSGIDLILAFIGGKFYVVNKREKWFFGILSVTSIFINAIGIQALLFPSLINHRESIDTFEELAEINPPIYIHQNLFENADSISEILRCLLIYFA